MIRRLHPWAGWSLAALLYVLWRVATLEAWGWRAIADARHDAMYDVLRWERYR